MRERTFGRTGWRVSEIGYGMWGMGGWTGSDDDESRQALARAVALGCSFFDTAWAYGEGHSERLLGEVRHTYPHAPMIVATKLPPKNRRWPGRSEDKASDTYPADHIREYTEISLANLGLDQIDLQQFHVWDDSWAIDEEWQRGVRAIKEQGLVRAVGISVNRWQPANVIRALDTGLIDSVQVVYNIFDQAAADELFPYCQAHNIAVIARVPFDEGSLTGTLRPDSTWPAGDWRNTYFTAERLRETLTRVERLEPLLPEDMPLPELALRFILEHPAVSTTIPGMRRVPHVEGNLRASDGESLPPRTVEALKQHRWER
jgi:aryl-alcohol dehydrogenase-like predicted oxidoreductase